MHVCIYVYNICIYILVDIYVYILHITLTDKDKIY